MADVVVTIGGNSKELKKLLRSEIRAMKRLENNKKRLERQGVSRRRRTRREEARERVQTERNINRRVSRQARRSSTADGRKGKIGRAVRRGGKALAIGGLGGLGLVTGLAAEVKGVLNYGKALSQMSVQAGISVKRQMEIEEQINRVSIATGASRDDIVAGIAAIVDKSGNLEFAAEAMEQMAESSQGSGASVRNLGFMFTALKTSLKLTNKEALKFSDILIAQGDIGSFTLDDISRSGEGLFGAAAAAGVRDAESFIQFGALMQTAGETATSSEAATAVRNLSNEMLGRAKKIKKISGVDVFRPGTTELKPIVDLMKEIVTGTGANITKLITSPGDADSTIGFRIRAVKPLKNLVASMKAGRGFADVDRFITAGVMENLAKIGRGRVKFQEVENRSSAITFEKLSALLVVASDKSLSPLLNEMAAGLRELVDNKDKMKEFTQDFRDFGEALAFVGGVIASIGSTIGSVRSSFAPIKEFFDRDTFFPKNEIKLDVKNEMTIDPVTGNTKNEKTTVTKQNNSDLGKTNIVPSAGR